MRYQPPGRVIKRIELMVRRLEKAGSASRRTPSLGCLSGMRLGSCADIHARYADMRPGEIRL